MSFEVTTAFVQQFKDNVYILSQQKGSRLRRGVTEDTEVVGKVAYYDQIGSTAARKVTERHGDSPLMNTPHRRRQVALHDEDWGDLVDDLDKVKMLIDPTSPYAVNAGFAMGRAIDEEIIVQLFAIANTGETGGTPVAFPAANQIAVNFSAGGNVGLTVEKLREARRLLRAGNVDLTDPLFISVTSTQMDNLLGTTQVTSADYNTVKALVQGDVDRFMGFDFIQTELLQLNGGGFRRCPAWSKTGMQLAIGKDIKSRMQERADKRFSMYIYYSMCIGATRLEEAKVIEVICVG